MAYSKDYFSLQLTFAQKVVDLTSLPLEEVLLTYTSFYKTFLIPGWDFDPQNKTWQKFINKFTKSDDKLTIVYDFYLEQINTNKTNDKHKSFGCFSYDVETDVETDDLETYVSIHFKNVDPPHPGALSKERFEVRKYELKQMFADIQKNHPDVKKVYGFSWLYNLPSYNRLFPNEYTQNYQVVDDWFKSTALWGQFLDSSGEVKKDLLKDFLNCLKTKHKLNELINCFPYRVLEPSAYLQVFHDFYSV